MIPDGVFFTKGVGRHREQLQSFELALRDAGIEKCNLVTVSSIYPPGCEVVPRAKGVEMLRAGEITFVVMSRNATNEPNRLIAASVGCALPTDKTTYGYLSEHHSFGQSDEVASEYAEDLAASMLASTLGIEYDSEKAWDEREQIFKISGKIVRTTNVTQSAVCDKNGLWTTVIAVAVFVFKPNGKPTLKDSEQKPAETHALVEQKPAIPAAPAAQSPAQQTLPQAVPQSSAHASHPASAPAAPSAPAHSEQKK